MFFGVLRCFWILSVFDFFKCDSTVQVSGSIPYFNGSSAWQRGPFYSYYAIILLNLTDSKSPAERICWFACGCWKEMTESLCTCSLPPVVIGNLVLPVIPSTGCGHKILSGLLFSKVGTLGLFLCQVCKTYSTGFLNASDREMSLLTQRSCE